jgi:squalene-hopene/tetraprenyl-beta-curcumene cyclase
VVAAEATPQEKAEREAKLQDISAKAIKFLATQQAEDGSYSRQAGPAVTALVTTAILKHGRTPQDPVVAKGLEYLEQFVHDDGGIYQPDSTHKNYETCLAVLCFNAANVDGRYDALLSKANAFIKELQWDEGEDADPSNFAYGGAGYGSHKRPDLSNTQFMLDALTAMGEDEDSEAIQRALVFVSRCQNLESADNTTPFPALVNDGGFYYTPAAGGTSQAGQTENGGLRSYASMTYAGLKSMIYAGVDRDDPRVKAAIKWLGRNYDLKSNPGMDQNGLYYYYHTFAKALDALGEDVFVDESGVHHDWRSELVQELAARQQENGSWINETTRWLEGDPSLVTGYSLLALAYCRDSAK